MVAGDEHGDEVGHRGAAEQQARGGGGQTEHLGGPGDDLTLAGDRRVVAPAAVGVEPARQQLGEHADRAAAAVHPAEETGMAIAHAVGGDAAEVIQVDVGGIGAVARQGIGPRGADGRRHWPPHRALAHRLDGVEGVVEHAVAEGAQRRGIGRIERGSQGCGPAVRHVLQHPRLHVLSRPPEDQSDWLLAKEGGSGLRVPSRNGRRRRNRCRRRGGRSRRTVTTLRRFLRHDRSLLPRPRRRAKRRSPAA